VIDWAPERLGRGQGKVQQARELLAPVYGWFTEGFDTRDMKEVKALLEDWPHERRPQVAKRFAQYGDIFE
jgi:hypothetical protein